MHENWKANLLFVSSWFLTFLHKQGFVWNANDIKWIHIGRQLSDLQVPCAQRGPAIQHRPSRLPESCIDGWPAFKDQNGSTGIPHPSIHGSDRIGSSQVTSVIPHCWGKDSHRSQVTFHRTCFPLKQTCKRIFTSSSVSPGSPGKHRKMRSWKRI